MPLVSARADAKVLNYGAEVSFTQTYRNNGATAIDATYVAASLHQLGLTPPATYSLFPSRAPSQVWKLVRNRTVILAACGPDVDRH